MPLDVAKNDIERATGSHIAGGRTMSSKVERFDNRGDHGVSLVCAQRSGSSVILGVGAARHVNPVRRRATTGFVGPTSLRGGQMYARLSHDTQCSVYWVAPVESYVLFTLFRTRSAATVATCHAGFAAIQPVLLDRLAMLK